MEINKTLAIAALAGIMSVANASEAFAEHEEGKEHNGCNSDSKETNSCDANTCEANSCKGAESAEEEAAE